METAGPVRRTGRRNGPAARRHRSSARSDRTCATHLLGEGVHPKIVSELLGHSDINVTRNLYSHVMPTMQKQAVDALDDLLGETLAVNSNPKH